MFARACRSRCPSSGSASRRNNTCVAWGLMAPRPSHARSAGRRVCPAAFVVLEAIILQPFASPRPLARCILHRGKTTPTLPRPTRHAVVQIGTTLSTEPWRVRLFSLRQHPQDIHHTHSAVRLQHQQPTGHHPPQLSNTVMPQRQLEPDEQHPRSHQPPNNQPASRSKGQRNEMRKKDKGSEDWGPQPSPATKGRGRRWNGD